MYDCGHKPKKIFIKKCDLVLFTIYNQWKESDSKLCFNCWNKLRRKMFIEQSLEVLERSKKENIPLTDPKIN